MGRASTGIISALLAAACGGGAQPGSTSRDSAGVRIITVARNEKRLEWRADTVRLLGGADTGFQSFYRVRNALVDVDPAGRIYVLDQIARRVVMFDSSGAFVASMGRKGGGPSELQEPLSVAVSNGGDVSVHDAGKGTLVWFGATREPLPEQPFAFTIINVNERQFDVTPSGIAVWARDPLGGTDERRDRLLFIAQRDTLTLARRSSYKATASYPRCGMRFSTAIPLSPRIRWSQWGDRIAVAAWGDDRIDIFDSGRWTQSIRVGDGGRELDQHEAIRILKERGYHGPCNSTPEELVRKIGFYPQPQTIWALAVEPNGTLWVRRVTNPGDRRIDVLDSAGTPIGVLPGTFPMPVTFLPDGRPLISVRDSLDVERLGVLRLRR